MSDINLLRSQLEQLQYYLNLTWTIFGVVIAVISIVGAILLRQWTKIETDKRFLDHESKISSLSARTKILKEGLDEKVQIGNNINGQYFFIENNTVLIAKQEKVITSKAAGSVETFWFVYPAMMSNKGHDLTKSVVSAYDQEGLPVSASVIDHHNTQTEVKLISPKLGEHITLTIFSFGTRN